MRHIQYFKYSMCNILSFPDIMNMKVLMRAFYTFFVLSLKPALYFISAALIGSDQTHFECSTATCVKWLPHGTTQDQMSLVPSRPGGFRVCDSASTLYLTSCPTPTTRLCLLLSRRCNAPSCPAQLPDCALSPSAGSGTLWR